MAIDGISGGGYTRIQQQILNSGKAQGTGKSDNSNAPQEGEAPGKSGSAPGKVNTPPKHRTIQQEILQEAPPAEAPPPPPASTAPVSQTAPVKPASDIKSLAQRYVDQYAALSGASLSTEQRASLVTEVANFYSDPSRAGRLETIVFA